MFPECDPRNRRFNDYINGNCRLEKLYSGTLWAEGPVYFCDGDFLLWSDIPNDVRAFLLDSATLQPFSHGRQSTRWFYVPPPLRRPHDFG